MLPPDLAAPELLDIIEAMVLSSFPDRHDLYRVYLVSKMQEANLAKNQKESTQICFKTRLS
jgi:hypothetical protein